jgi:hypothetical protein
MCKAMHSRSQGVCPESFHFYGKLHKKVWRMEGGNILFKSRAIITDKSLLIDSTLPKESPIVKSSPTCGISTDTTPPKSA